MGGFSSQCFNLRNRSGLCRGSFCHFRPLWFECECNQAISRGHSLAPHSLMLSTPRVHFLPSIQLQYNTVGKMFVAIGVETDLDLYHNQQTQNGWDCLKNHLSCVINDGRNGHMNHKEPFSSDHLVEEDNLSIRRDLGQPSAYQGQAKKP